MKTAYISLLIVTLEDPLGCTDKRAWCCSSFLPVVRTLFSKSPNAFDFYSPVRVITDLSDIDR